MFKANQPIQLLPSLQPSCQVRNAAAGLGLRVRTVSVHSDGACTPSLEMPVRRAAMGRHLSNFARRGTEATISTEKEDTEN